MVIIAIDPGTDESACVVYSTPIPVVTHRVIAKNEDLIKWLRKRLPTIHHVLAVEWITSYGQIVGREIFETCAWVGRFEEAFPGPAYRVARRDVKLHLCNSVRAKDSNIRQALLDRFGGSRKAALGTKAKPGPLYGFKTHLWSALGVAVTYAETIAEEGIPGD